MANNLRILIDNEFYICCPLLSTGYFVDYCKARGVKISPARLERLEKLGLFYPVARVNRPELTFKMRPAEEANSYYDEGVLEDGESWDGETRKTLAHISFQKDYALEWLNAGRLWSPQAIPFQEWKSYKIPDFYDDDVMLNPMENYYSRFQIFQLHNLLELMSNNRNLAHLDNWYGLDEKELNDLIVFMKNNASEVVTLAQKDVNGTGSLSPISGYVCQVISNRYYPKTRTDQRFINVTRDSSYRNFNWRKYALKWDAKAALNLLGINIDDVQKMHEQIQLSARNIDPLYNWKLLVNFVHIDKKDKLEDNALLAQSFYGMEEMLAYFYKDIAGEDIRSQIVDAKWSKSFYGDDVLMNSYELLEYVTNEYHLNPRPRMILFVEGPGEEKQIPRIAKEVFGSDFSNLGIRVENLRGVGGFEGKKAEQGGRLLKIIEHYHKLQTIVFVVLDNEGRTKNVRDKLIDIVTETDGIIKKITKEEYVRLWEKSIEFDNFTDQEIANAMTTVANNRYRFTPDEINIARESMRGRSLERLNTEKLNYDLSKPELLEVLVAHIIENIPNEFDKNGEPKRKILSLISEIIKIATTNHQPISKKHWRQNQKSGHMGDVLE